MTNLIFDSNLSISGSQLEDPGSPDFRITNIVIDVKKKIKHKNKLTLPPINMGYALNAKPNILQI